LYHDTDERESYEVEALVPVDRIQVLLVHLGITTASKYQIKGVPRPGRVEYWAIAEILFGYRLIIRHQGQTFRASSSHVVADTA
jgi:hypothetical protein